MERIVVITLICFVLVFLTGCIHPETSNPPISTASPTTIPTPPKPTHIPTPPPTPTYPPTKFHIGNIVEKKSVVTQPGITNTLKIVTIDYPKQKYGVLNDDSMGGYKVIEWADFSYLEEYYQ